MKDTTFYLSKEQLPRLASSYRRTEDGRLERAEIQLLAKRSPTETDRVPLANGGLFSTAADYTRFCQMLLGGGASEGTRILKPETVRKFSAVHSGDLKTGFTPGNAWGIGCCIVREPQGSPNICPAVRLDMAARTVLKLGSILSRIASMS